ncbi:MAG: FKBP-type peptidyl-prolyl cis-trans isomerase [Candidatus Thermoplasmatota archaeon]
MENERIALVALFVIVVVGVAGFLIADNWDEIAGNLTDKTEEGEVVETGDCVDVHYVGKYASNETIFDYSYNDYQNKTGGQPAEVFVSFNQSKQSPKGYSNYSSGYVEGFKNGLIGLEEGETKTFTVSPEEGYGEKVEEGDIFTTSQVCPFLNQTLNVTSFTADKIVLKWVDLPEGNFTMPMGYIKENCTLMDFYYGNYIKRIPPYHLWENSSVITNISSDSVTVLTTPAKSENISDQFQAIMYGNKMGVLIPEITTASWNDTKIKISTVPEEGATYEITSQGQTMSFEVTNVTDETFNLTFQSSQGTESQIFNKTMIFDRVYSFKRVYSIPLYLSQMGQEVPMAMSLLENDLNKVGVSLHDLAGETLKYEVTIEKIYNTSSS